MTGPSAEGALERGRESACQSDCLARTIEEQVAARGGGQPERVAQAVRTALLHQPSRERLPGGGA